MRAPTGAAASASKIKSDSILRAIPSTTIRRSMRIHERPAEVGKGPAHRNTWKVVGLAGKGLAADKAERWNRGIHSNLAGGVIFATAVLTIGGQIMAEISNFRKLAIQARPESESLCRPVPPAMAHVRWRSSFRNGGTEREHPRISRRPLRQQRATSRSAPDLYSRQGNKVATIRIPRPADGRAQDRRRHR